MENVFQIVSIKKHLSLSRKETKQSNMQTYKLSAHFDTNKNWGIIIDLLVRRMNPST